MNNSKEKHSNARILVVDDSVLTLEVIQRNLSAAGYDVYTVASVDQAIDFLKQDSVDLVITDIKMPKISGLELLKYVKENLKGTEIMIITGYPSIKGAVEAVKDGAEDYLVKPFTDEELLAAVIKMLEKQANRHAAEVKPIHGNSKIIGNSLCMQNVYRLIDKAAGTKVNVLITGESGTGKELVALSTITAVSIRVLLLRLIVLRFLTHCLKVNCLAMSKALLQEQNLPEPAFFRLPMGGRYF